MVVPDFISEEEAEALRLEFKKAKYQRREQSRKELRGLEGMIEVGEVYSAKFWRTAVETFGIDKRIRDFLGCEFVDLRAHKMGVGDHFRSHVDDGVGTCGITLTLSKGWKWDWGGILMVLEGGEMKSYLPKWRELVVIKGSPHFVSPICPWALEARLTLVGFGK